MRPAIGTALALFGLAMLCQHCGPSPESVYAGQVARCIDEAKTKAESRACRARVDAAHGITQTVADGGAP